VGKSPPVEDAESHLVVMKRARALWPRSVRFSDPHATGKIQRRGIPLDHIGEVIRGGCVRSHRFEGGEWRYRVEGRTSDETYLACIVAFEEQRQRLVIVTVYKCRPPRRRREEGDRT
jgi:hypothetical protein